MKRERRCERISPARSSAWRCPVIVEGGMSNPLASSPADMVSGARWHSVRNRARRTGCESAEKPEILKRSVMSAC